MSDRTYYVAFDTQEMPGKIKAVSVTLNNEIIADMDKQLPINLCDDPLYPNLVRYVMANPPRR